MKKVLSLASLVFAFAFANAQSYQVSYNDNPLTPGDTISITALSMDCSFYFSLDINNTTALNTIYATERLNNSDIVVTSVCAGFNCFANSQQLAHYATPVIHLDPGTHDDNHVEFYVPSGTPDALFKFNIYDNDNNSDNFFFYIKVINQYVGIDELASADTKLSVYPNPATSMVTIQAEGSENEEVVIYNTLGSEVKKATLNSGTATVDVSDLPAGIYFYGLQGSTKRSKFVVL